MNGWMQSRDRLRCPVAKRSFADLALQLPELLDHAAGPQFLNYAMALRPVRRERFDRAVRSEPDVAARDREQLDIAGLAEKCWPLIFEWLSWNHSHQCSPEVYHA